MNGDPLIWPLILQLVLILLNAVFACAEIAVITFNDLKLQQLAAAGDRRAMRLSRLTSQPARFLATIQVAITLSGFLGSAFAADNFSDRLVALLLNAGLRIPAATLDTVCVVLITLLLSYFTLVFGELVPKRIAMKKAESLALGLSGPIAFISVLFKPVVSLLTASTNGILRLLGIDPQAEEETATEEEIRMMVDVGSEKGTIEHEEREMIQNVFEFDDVTADDILTHRTQVDLLMLDDTDAEWAETIHASRHTRYPVCGESPDDVLGVLDARDYFRLSDRSRDNVLKNAVEPARFVPETVRANDLFREMQKSRNPFAVVLDEFGGMCGIVTMNDLIEQIVGDMPEGEDDDTLLIAPADDGRYLVHGSAPLELLGETLGLPLPEDDFETLNGLVLSRFSAIPADGSRFSTDVAGLHVEVTDFRNHLIERALVSPLPPADAAAAGTAAVGAGA